MDKDNKIFLKENLQAKAVSQSVKRGTIKHFKVKIFILIFTIIVYIPTFIIKLGLKSN